MRQKTGTPKGARRGAKKKVIRKKSNGRRRVKDGGVKNIPKKFYGRFHASDPIGSGVKKTNHQKRGMERIVFGQNQPSENSGEKAGYGRKRGEGDGKSRKHSGDTKNLLPKAEKRGEGGMKLIQAQFSTRPRFSINWLRGKERNFRKGGREKDGANER